MSTTPIFQITEMNAAQAQPHLTFNQAVRILEALAQCGVTSKSVSVPPTEIVDGDRYIVGSGALDAWSDNVDNLAIGMGGAWRFVRPLDGAEVWVADEALKYRFRTGSPGGWISVADGGGGGGGGGAAPVLDDDASAAPAAGSFDNYAGGGFDGSQTRYLITPTGGDVTLNGIVATNAVDGQITAIANEDGANSVICANQVGSSTAGNRFSGPGGGDLVIIPGQVKLFIRISSRWRAI